MHLVTNEKTTHNLGTKDDGMPPPPLVLQWHKEGEAKQRPFLDAAKDAWYTFCSSTSLHGIPHVGQSRGKFRAVSWLLVSLAMLGWLIYNIWTISMNYQACDVLVRTSISLHRKTGFPSVTFCNMNALKKSEVKKNPELNKLIFEKSNAGQHKGAIYSAGIPVWTLSAVGSSTAREPEEGIRETTLKERVLMALAAMPMEEKQALGYSIDDMLVTCRFAGTKCNISTDFSRIYNEIYGNCYSFNWQQAPSLTLPDETWLTSSKTGPEYGLELVFNVQEYQYTKGQMEGVGMRVILHSHNQMPFPNDEGILIPPGQLTHVGVKKKKMERLLGRCSTCVADGQTEPEINMYSGMYGAGYTVKGCYKTCFQENVMEKCGCANPSLPIPENISKAGIDICDYSTIGSCFEKVQDEFYNNKIKCNCNRHPCIEKSYDMISSAIPWPPVQNDDEVREMLEKHLKPEELDILYSNETGIATNKVERHIAKLVIYHKDFNVEKSIEFLAYESSQIWPDLGGILGLYAGISFITLLELAEFILDIIIALLKSTSNASQHQPTDVSPKLKI